MYATNLFRQVCRYACSLRCVYALAQALHRKQSADPALSTIMRNRRVQFLPVMWRANFGMTIEDAHLREEEGLDNRFGIEGTYDVACVVTCSQAIFQISR